MRAPGRHAEAASQQKMLTRAVDGSGRVSLGNPDKRAANFLGIGVNAIEREGPVTWKHC
jgi:hypothetical protein